jgi:carboxyl-terminal processing protease
MLRILLLLAIACLTICPSESRAQEQLGAREIVAALNAIERRCAADVSTAIGPAIQQIRELAAHHGAMDLANAATTQQGVLETYERALAAAPTIDEAELARAAIDGMVSGVDGVVEGGYVEFRPCNCTAGIGVELRASEPYHTVLYPLPGTPAERAGLMPGDRIAAIDGVDVAGMQLARIVRLFRGEPGTTVSVTISRDNPAESATYVITRVVIIVRTVTWSTQGDVGHIAIKYFGENTARRVREAIREIRQHIRAPRGYIIDLRNNSGGLLDQAIETADLFLEAGVVGSVLSAGECTLGETTTYHSRRGDVTRGLPLIVLTNGQTASGAELLLASLLDRGRAVSVGQRTFGVGSVATVIPISDRAGIRLITGEISSPAGGVLTGGRPPVFEVPEATQGTDPAVDRALELLANRLAFTN